MNQEKELGLLQNLIASAVKERYNVDVEPSTIEGFESAKMGKVFYHQKAFPVFRIIRQIPADKNPNEAEEEKGKKKKKKKGGGGANVVGVAKELAVAVASVLKKKEWVEKHFIEKVEAEGPYLNFYYEPGYIGQLVDDILHGDFLKPKAQNGTNVMIEYSQPNTHKTFHVGHMRNAALGMSLVKLFRHQGYNVTAANYIGDVGTHIAKCLWYYLNVYEKRSDVIDNDVPKGIKRVEFLGEMYSKSSQQLSLAEYAAMPIKGFLIAQVKDIQPHPSNPKWKVVTLQTEGTHQVVCGGKGYAVGDLIPYAPVGAKYKKKEITVGDKEGVKSEGFILSEKELGIEDGHPDKIKVFTEADFVDRITTIKNNGTKEEIKIPALLPRGELPTPGTTLVNASRIPNTDVDVNEDILAVLAKRDGEVKQILRRLEAEEPEINALWEKTRQWSLDDFDDIYKWTNTEFDIWFYESQVGEEGKKLCRKAYEDGILVESGGAIGADLKTYKMPGTKRDLGFCVLITSANTGLYATKDIALARLKFEKYEIDRSIYVVDASQAFHFQQVFKVLELMGFEQAKQCYHLPYGLVTLADGKMSSRAGTVIFFSKLQSLLTEKIRSTFLNKYVGDWSDQEIDHACHVIALATIKYGMLNQDNSKNIIFEMDEWLNPQGNTGPYMLYAYARTRSVLRKITVSSQTKDQIDYSLLRHPAELGTLNLLREYDTIVETACESYRPSVLTNYLYALSKQYSRLYESVSVKYAGTPALCATRLALVEAVGNVIRHGLDLLGIETLDRM